MFCFTDKLNFDINISMDTNKLNGFILKDMPPGAEDTSQEIKPESSIKKQVNAYRHFIAEKLEGVLNIEQRDRGPNLAQLFVELKKPDFKKNPPSNGFKGMIYQFDKFINTTIKYGIDSKVFENATIDLYKFLTKYKSVSKTDFENAPDVLMMKIRHFAEEAKQYDGFNVLEWQLIREMVEYNQEEFRKEFKIHLNPQSAYAPEIQKKIFELLSTNTSFRSDFIAIKITLRDENVPISNDFRSDIADVILYIDPKENLELTMQCCKNVLEILKNSFQGDFEKGKTLDQPPRYNFPINQLIYIAQSGGDFKDWLKRIPDISADRRDENGYLKKIPGRSASDSMLDSFFDKRVDCAFFNEDSKKAQELFGPLQKSV